MATGFETLLLEQVARYQHHLLTEFFAPITAFGSLPVAVLIVLGLYLLHERESALFSTVGIGIAGGIEVAVNLLVQRPRPDIVPRLIEGTASGYGFPSGHTTIAFVLAAVLAGQYPRLRWYCYTIAALVGISRVYLGMHYPSDVVAGAVLGSAVGWGIRYQSATIRDHLPAALQD